MAVSLASLNNKEDEGYEKLCHLKSELALLQTLLCLIHLVQFVKCWQIFLELNSKRLSLSSGKEKKFVFLCSRPGQKVKLGIFTSQSLRQRNV